MQSDGVQAIRELEAPETSQENWTDWSVIFVAYLWMFFLEFGDVYTWKYGRSVHWEYLVT